jgi:L,D-peptidoglycan transpeptidase YkuD (ErfK/YbiS/YcfS/YnhG family)
VSDLVVDPETLTLTAFGATMACAIGRGGVVPAAQKREGDGATPTGAFALLAVLLRPDRDLPHPLALPWRWLRPDDGWCDAPEDPDYNRPVRLPYRSSAEHLWKEHEAYDAIIVLGHNHAPPVPFMGSAIFLHVARHDTSAPDGLRPTAGCVAVPRPALLSLLPRLRPGLHLHVGSQA